MSEITDHAHTMTPEALAILRREFAPAAIGKLPRITCKACRDARGKVCDRQDHRKVDCAACGNWITSAHIHLDYVGHADVTDRLLEADPAWTWEPFALSEEDGTPLISRNGSELTMWIRLTVCGVTRPGVGSVAPDSFDVAKQLIGDALRNAAMRFGIALDLWTKHEALDSTIALEDAPAAQSETPAPPVEEPLAEGMIDTIHAKQELVAALTEAGAAAPKEAAAEAWKKACIAAGPIPRDRLDKIIGKALDALFAQQEAEAIPEGYDIGPPE